MSYQRGNRTGPVLETASNIRAVGVNYTLICFNQRCVLYSSLAPFFHYLQDFIEIY